MNVSRKFEFLNTAEAKGFKIIKKCLFLNFIWILKSTRFPTLVAYFLHQNELIANPRLEPALKVSSETLNNVEKCKFTLVYSCVLLCTLVYSCVLLCTLVYSCVLLCTLVYSCVLLCTLVYSCVFLCTLVYSCVLLRNSI